MEMNTGGPPARLAAFFLRMIPREHRAQLENDFRREYVSPARFIWSAIVVLYNMLPRRAVLVFDVRLVAGEAALLWIAFAGAPLGSVLTLIVVRRNVGSSSTSTASPMETTGKPRLCFENTPRQ